MEFYPPSCLEEALAYVYAAESYQKVGFIRSLLQTCGKDELTCVMRIAQKFRGKPESLKRKWVGDRCFPGRKKKSTTSKDVGNPDLSVGHPSEEVVEVEKENWGQEPKKEEEEDWEQQALREAQDRTRKWWVGRQIMSFDVEAVPVFTGKKNKKGNPSCKPVAATVAAVNPDMKNILDAKIYHKGGSFDINDYTKKTNGIMNQTDLEDGESFDVVQAKFVNRSIGKIIVTCGGSLDFTYLDLQVSRFETFNLQSHYTRTCINNPSVQEPMSLRDIYFYHFQDDCQRGAHTAEIDALATMRVFNEGYKNIFDKKKDFDDTPNLKKLEEQGRFWCRVVKHFVRKCKCPPCEAAPSFK